MARARVEDLKPNDKSHRAPEYDIYKAVALKSDVWSLGLTILELVTWFVFGWGSFAGRKYDGDKSRVGLVDNVKIMGSEKANSNFSYVQGQNEGQFGAQLSRRLVDVSANP